MACAPAESAAISLRSVSTVRTVSLPSGAVVSPAPVSNVAIPRLASPLDSGVAAIPSLPAADAFIPAVPLAQTPSAAAFEALPQLEGISESRLSYAQAYDGSESGLSFSPEAAGPQPAAPKPSARLGSSEPEAPAGKPQPPAPKRKSWLMRLNESTHHGSRAEKYFERSIQFGIVATLAAPILWNVMTLHTLLMTFTAAMALPLLALVPVTVFRVGRFLLGKEKPVARDNPARLARIAAIGLSLGMTLGAAPQIFQPRLVSAVERVVFPYNETTAVKGPALGEEVIKELSATPTGREILDELRDRGGVIRLPSFFVRSIDGDGMHVGIYNAVFISKRLLEADGLAVEDFVKNPEAQRAFVRRHVTLFGHELTHGGQAKRPAYERGHFKPVQEHEYEAFVNEHLIIHERLQADPAALLSREDESVYVQALEDLDGYLAIYDKEGSYANNKHMHIARYEAKMARLKAGWEAHRVEGYLLLARRNGDNPGIARIYRENAAEIAAAHHLPAPAVIVAAKVK